MYKTNSFKKENRILKKYMNNITTDIVPVLEKNKVILAGGAIRSIFSREEPKDFDFFFRSEEYLISFLNDLKSKKIIKKKIDTENAVTIVTAKKVVVQLIIKTFGEPEAILNNFDIRACMGCFDFATKDWLFHKRFHSDLAAKQVIVNKNLQYPFCTFFRMLKYQQKGFCVPPSEVLKVCLACKLVKIETFQDWKEQMLGVDAIILHRLLEHMQTNNLDFGKEFDAEMALKYIDDFLERDDLVVEEEVVDG